MLLVKNGTVVNADRQFKADVLIDSASNKIVRVEAGIEAPASCRVIDATDKLVIPGGAELFSPLSCRFFVCLFFFFFFLLFSCAFRRLPSE